MRLYVLGNMFENLVLVFIILILSGYSVESSVDFEANLGEKNTESFHTLFLFGILNIADSSVNLHVRNFTSQVQFAKQTEASKDVPFHDLPFHGTVFCGHDFIRFVRARFL